MKASALTLPFLDHHRDTGLLVLRVGMGVMFMTHGWPKLVGGPDKWARVGVAMGELGFGFGYEFWGFMASITEFGGGLALAVGLLTRPVCALLVFTMFVAAMKHLLGGDGFSKASHAIEAGITFVGIFVLGAGRFSVDAKLFGARDDGD